MNPAEKIIELLRWIKKLDVSPKHPATDELFLNPVSQTISTWQDLRWYQKSSALWIPSVKGLRDKGIKALVWDVAKLKVAHCTLANTLIFTGAGPGEPEALLSMFNQLKLALHGDPNLLKAHF